MNRHYELVLMLDPETADEAREKVAGDVRQAIEGAGTLDQADVWGVRKMAYEIKQRNEADYRYYRFQGEPELLERLDHSLKITDGVLRFRVFKVDPDAPANRRRPTSERLAPRRRSRRRERRGRAAAIATSSRARSRSFRPLCPGRGRDQPPGYLDIEFGIQEKRS